MRTDVAYVEQVRLGRTKERSILGIKLGISPDVLCIAQGRLRTFRGRKFLVPLIGYNQIGCFKQPRPHEFQECDKVIVEHNGRGKIFTVKKAQR